MQRCHLHGARVVRPHISRPRMSVSSLFITRKHSFSLRDACLVLAQTARPTNREVYNYPCAGSALASFLRGIGWAVVARDANGSNSLNDKQLFAAATRYWKSIGQKFTAAKWDEGYYGPLLW